MEGLPIPSFSNSLHQAGFTEPRRRLGEVLVRLELQESGDVPRLQVGEGFQIVQPLVVTRFRRIQVEAGETRELHHRAGGPEEILLRLIPVRSKSTVVVS